LNEKTGKLAALGGEPACRVDWPAWPIWGKEDEAAVSEVVNTGGWGICPEPNAVSRFAQSFADAHHAKHAVPCCNGTVAIMIALRAVGVLPGHEVIMPSYTFMATATAAIGIGATPVVVDVDPLTYNLDPAKIEEAITDRTRAILPVHIAGMPAAMDEITGIAEKHGLKVVEDCAQAHLARYREKPVGAIGHAGTFSFQSSKNLCAGEGGIVLTNDLDAFRVAHAFHHCGRDPTGGKWYDHPYMGQNLRMGQLQAALLASQMQRLVAQHETRLENGRYLAEKVSDIDGMRVIGWPWPEQVTAASYHIFIFTFDRKLFHGVNSAAFCEALRAEGVPCHGGYDRSLQDHDFFEDPFVERMLGKDRPDYKSIDTPVARSAVSGSVWIKQFMLLAGRDAMDRIAGAVAKVRDNAGELSRILA